MQGVLVDSTDNVKNIDIYIGEDYPIQVEGTPDTIFNFTVRQSYASSFPEDEEHLNYVNFDPGNAKWVNYTYGGYEDPLNNCQCQYLLGEYTMTISATTIDMYNYIDRVYPIRIKIDISDNVD